MTDLDLIPHRHKAATAIIEAELVPLAHPMGRTVSAPVLKALLWVVWCYEGHSVPTHAIAVRAGCTDSTAAIGLGALVADGLLIRADRRGARANRYLLGLDRLREYATIVPPAASDFDPYRHRRTLGVSAGGAAPMASRRAAAEEGRQRAAAAIRVLCPGGVFPPTNNRTAPAVARRRLVWWWAYRNGVCPIRAVAAATGVGPGAARQGVSALPPWPGGPLVQRHAAVQGFVRRCERAEGAAQTRAMTDDEVMTVYEALRGVAPAVRKGAA